jgi:hypothetical protein
MVDRTWSAGRSGGPGAPPRLRVSRADFQRQFPLDMG